MVGKFNWSKSALPRMNGMNLSTHPNITLHFTLYTLHFTPYTFSKTAPPPADQQELQTAVDPKFCGSRCQKARNQWVWVLGKGGRGSGTDVGRNRSIRLTRRSGRSGESGIREPTVTIASGPSRELIHLLALPCAPPYTALCPVPLPARRPVPCVPPCTAVPALPCAPPSTALCPSLPCALCPSLPCALYPSLYAAGRGTLYTDARYTHYTVHTIHRCVLQNHIIQMSDRCA